MKLIIDIGIFLPPHLNTEDTMERVLSEANFSRFLEEKNHQNQVISEFSSQFLQLVSKVQTKGQRFEVIIIGEKERIVKSTQRALVKRLEEKSDIFCIERFFSNTSFDEDTLSGYAGDGGFILLSAEHLNSTQLATSVIESNKNTTDSTAILSDVSETYFQDHYQVAFDSIRTLHRISEDSDESDDVPLVSSESDILNEVCLDDDEEEDSYKMDSMRAVEKDFKECLFEVARSIEDILSATKVDYDATGSRLPGDGFTQDHSSYTSNDETLQSDTEARAVVLGTSLDEFPLHNPVMPASVSRNSFPRQETSSDLSDDVISLPEEPNKKRHRLKYGVIFSAALAGTVIGGGIGGGIFSLPCAAVGFAIGFAIGCFLSYGVENKDTIFSGRYDRRSLLLSTIDDPEVGQDVTISL